MFQLLLHLSHEILTEVWSEVRTADTERVKNFRRAVTTSVQEAKPPRYITEEQWGTLKNLKQGKSSVVHMADSGIAIELLDTDPYHAMKTPLVEIALPPFIKGDQPEHMSHKLSEKLHQLSPCQKMLTTKSD